MNEEKSKNNINEDNLNSKNNNNNNNIKENLNKTFSNLKKRKKKLLYNIENINLKSHKRLINSPRSILACKILGILPEELIFKNFSQFLNENSSIMNLSKDIQKIRYENIEKYRQGSVRLVKEERQKIIEKENNNNNNNKEKQNINKKEEEKEKPKTE